MMIHQDIQELINNIQNHQQQYQNNILQLTQVVLELKEENNRLRMLNHNLEDQLQKLVNESVTQEEDTPIEEQHISGKDRLQGFYDDGIHVCHELFGKRRQSSEDCLFCQDVLMRLSKG